MSNEGYIDLHLHSSHSDGLHPPSELVRMAAEKGLRAIAIADHDSVAGIDEALEAGGRHGVEVIPAVELSVSFRSFRDVHLLGYLIDHRDPRFIAMLEQFSAARFDRGRAILERINARLSGENRTTVDYGEVLSIAGGTVGRPHIARVLVEKGLARSVEDAFERYLEPCNVPKFQVHAADAIAEIRRIGGVAVLAHPPSISRNREILREVIGHFSDLGLDGVELFSNMCYKEDTDFINGIAARLGLLVTGGSDYHGFNSDEEMGKVRGVAAIPYRMVGMLKEARARHTGRMDETPAIQGAGMGYHNG